MKIYFATAEMEGTPNDSLNRIIGTAQRLISFHYIYSSKRNDLRRYVRYGKIKKGEVNENK